MKNLLIILVLLFSASLYASTEYRGLYDSCAVIYSIGDGGGKAAGDGGGKAAGDGGGKAAGDGGGKSAGDGGGYKTFAYMACIGNLQK